jgi:hypothetical protein
MNHYKQIHTTIFYILRTFTADSLVINCWVCVMDLASIKFGTVHLKFKGFQNQNIEVEIERMCWCGPALYWWQRPDYCFQQSKGWIHNYKILGFITVTLRECVVIYLLQAYNFWLKFLFCSVFQDNARVDWVMIPNRKVS